MGDLVQMHAEHLVIEAEVSSCGKRYAQLAMEQGSMASGSATESKIQELASKIHGMQVATDGQILCLSQDFAFMRSEVSNVTEVVTQAAAASIQRTEARLATELDSKCAEFRKFVGAQQEELHLKASSSMGKKLVDLVSQ